MRLYVSGTATAMADTVSKICLESGAYHVKNGYVDVSEPLAASDGVNIDAWFDSAAWTGAKPLNRRFKVEYWGR